MSMASFAFNRIDGYSNRHFLRVTYSVSSIPTKIYARNSIKGKYETDKRRIRRIFSACRVLSGSMYGNMQ